MLASERAISAAASIAGSRRPTGAPLLAPSASSETTPSARQHDGGNNEARNAAERAGLLRSNAADATRKAGRGPRIG